MILSTILRSKASSSLVGLVTTTATQQYAQYSNQSSSGSGGRPERFNYDNILSRLSISETFDEVYSIYANNKDKFNTEHFAMASRSLGRIYRKTSTVPKKQVHQAFEKRIVEEIPKLNPQQCIDYLFMIRALNDSNVLRLPRDKTEEFFKKLNEYIDSNSYAFRSYISIYYDLAQLGRLTRGIRERLYERFCEQIEKGSLRNLSMFNLSMLIKAMAAVPELAGRDIQIYDKLVEYIDTNSLYKQSSIEQKAVMFLHFARIYYNNNVSYPRFMKVLEHEFLEKMEDLTEKSILSIIEASTLLPGKSFKIGEEIRKVLIDNMSGKEASSIEPGFFLDCLNKFTYMKRRRFSAVEVGKATEYLLEQIPLKDKTNRTQDKLNRLINNNGFFTHEAAFKIVGKVLKTTEATRLDDLDTAVNIGCPIEEYVQKYYNLNKEKMDSYKLIRLYLIITGSSEAGLKDKLKPILAEAQKEVDAQLEKEWWHVVRANRNSHIRDTLRVDICTKLMNRIEKIKPEEISKDIGNILFQTLVKVSITKPLKQRVSEFIQKHKEQLTTFEMRRSLETALREYSDSTYYLQLSTLLELAELGNARMGNILRETDLIKSTVRFQNLSNRVIGLVREQFNIPFKVKQVEGEAPEEPEATNIPEKEGKEKAAFQWNQQFESIMRKFEDSRIDSTSYRTLLNSIVFNLPNFNRRNAQFFTELLHYKGLLNKQKAELIKNVVDLNSNLENKNKAFFEHLLDAAINSDVLPTNFAFEPLRMNKISLLLQYPTKLYSDKIPPIIEHITKAEGNPREWYNLVLTMRRPASDSADFGRIANAALLQFEVHSKSMRPNEIIRLARKADQLEVNSRRFWSKLYNEVAANWEDYTFYDKIVLMEILQNRLVDVVKEVKGMLEALHDGSVISGDARTKFFRVLAECNTRFSEEEWTAIDKIVASTPLTSEEGVNYLKLLVSNPQHKNCAELVKSTYKQLDETTRDKMKSSFLAEYLSKLYPDLGIVFAVPESRDVFSQEIKELEEIKPYFNKASELTKLPVEYNKVDNGCLIDVVFGGHYIKFFSRSNLFFIGSNRLTLYGYFLKTIVEMTTKKPVVLMNFKWFAKEDNKYHRLKEQIPELEKHEVLKTLDTPSSGRSEGRSEGRGEGRSEGRSEGRRRASPAKEEEA